MRTSPLRGEALTQVAGHGAAPCQRACNFPRWRRTNVTRSLVSASPCEASTARSRPVADVSYATLPFELMPARIDGDRQAGANRHGSRWSRPVQRDGGAFCRCLIVHSAPGAASLTVVGSLQ